MLAGGQAFAGTYGSGGYSSCTYQKSCSPTPAPSSGGSTTQQPPTTTTQPATPGVADGSTRVTLTDGSAVDINLTDGAIIPKAGKDITVTPVDSSQTFKQVEISVNGQHVYTMLPGADGVGTWRWDPSIHPGSIISFDIVDAAGGITHRSFNVTVSGLEAITNDTTQSSAGSASNGSSNVDTSIAAKLTNLVKHTLQALPQPVVIAFPYLLLGLIAANILVLFIQTRREVAARHTLEALITHERAINQAKENVISLTSHYLRTPLTLVKNGAELLKSAGLDQALIDRINTTVNTLAQKVELILSEDLPPKESAPIISPANLNSRTAWLTLWTPIALAGVLAFAFVYLANHYTAVKASTVSLATQLAVFGLLAVSAYLAFRHRDIKRRDRAYAEQLLSAETAVNSVRDSVIDNTAQLLAQDLRTFDTLIGQVPQGPMTKFIHDGQRRMRQVAGQFIIANQLKGSRSTAPYQAVQLQTIQQSALDALAVKLTEKHDTVTPAADAPVVCQNPELLSLVLKSLIDNAIAYSPEQSTIMVTGSNQPQQLQVSDHGDGIPADKLSELFQPFSKAEGSEVFEHEGMGFSLYLDKLIMLYLGGDISLTSTPQVGTTTIMSWPAGLDA